MTTLATASSELVPADNMAAIEAMDPETRELAVTQMLTEARSWLAHAVEATEPKTIANFKAQMATVAEATRQLGLSKEIQLDAQEMVRRAEYALARSIRRGQAEGTIASTSRQAHRTTYDERAKPSDFAPDVELYDRPSQHKAGILSIADNATPERFDEAIAEAKAEGDLSRANVSRKVKGIAKGQTTTGPTTRDQRADLIVKLANEGYSSRQMPAKVGVTEETVRQIAREYGIEIPADRAISKTRRINSTQVVVNTATALEGLVSGVELIDYDALDLQEVRQWATSLTDSLRTLNRFAKQIKEMTQ